MLEYSKQDHSYLCLVSKLVPLISVELEELVDAHVLAPRKSLSFFIIQKSTMSVLPPDWECIEFGIDQKNTSFHINKKENECIIGKVLSRFMGDKFTTAFFEKYPCCSIVQKYKVSKIQDVVAFFNDTEIMRKMIKRRQKSFQALKDELTKLSRNYSCRTTPVAEENHASEVSSCLAETGEDFSFKATNNNLFNVVKLDIGTTMLNYFNEKSQGDALIFNKSAMAYYLYIKQTESDIQEIEFLKQERKLKLDKLTLENEEIRCRLDAEDSQPETFKKRKVSAKVRADVWVKHVVNEENKMMFRVPCYCCGSTPISPFCFEAGHVVSKFNGGDDTVNNLRPICSLCNRSCSSRNLKEFAITSGFNSELTKELN